jgi:alanine racemase
VEHECVPAPAIALNGEILRENAGAWKRRTNAKVYAVVKADGYGFGLERIVRELDGVADGFVATDAADLYRTRALTNAPVATLADLGPEHAARVVELRGTGNVARIDSLRALAARSDAAEITVRIGLRLAAGWSAIEMADAEAFAEIAAASSLRVELWTHLTALSTEHDDRARFARFVEIFKRRGVRIAGEDIESTAPAARGRAGGSAVRIGVGLFGSGGLACAIGVTAPVWDRVRSDGTLRASYTAQSLAPGTEVTVLRCGYANGFPRITRPYRRILSLGMQNCIISGVVEDETFELLGPDNDLDELAAAAATVPHQIVCGLGLASGTR